jgi:hypothetical protein
LLSWSLVSFVFDTLSAYLNFTASLSKS